MLPAASLAVTVTLAATPAGCDAGKPEVVRDAAAPGSTAKAELLAADRLSPLVRVAVRATPLSALEQMTPVIVFELVPAVMVSDKVPPKVPAVPL